METIMKKYAMAWARHGRWRYPLLKGHQFSWTWFGAEGFGYGESIDVDTCLREGKWAS